MRKTLSFNEINKLADDIIDVIDNKTVIALIGDLGTGKTTFVKRLAQKLEVTDIVKSPTFNYVIEYLTGKIPIYHFDVYRLCEPSEIYEIGYEDYLNSDGIIVIEWANIIQSELPDEYLQINLYYSDDEEREIEIKYVGNDKKNEEILKYVGFSN
ncbi:MAG: tRNA (adenosine(37)-N6)-threonylcarbamoyltransferase complex ATPase subunit type 1 TsaE [Fusobacteria bacterium]|nr:tRNA (adenosine(37)-N6)-threonylcarbamoyltransferase complex ATPase subunit type 1 TsaE [Fusobacteriota bacterium]